MGSLRNVSYHMYFNIRFLSFPEAEEIEVCQAIFVTEFKEFTKRLNLSALVQMKFLNVKWTTKKSMWYATNSQIKDNEVNGFFLIKISLNSYIK